MLLPEFVYAHEHDSLVPLLDDGAAVGIGKASMILTGRLNTRLPSVMGTSIMEFRPRFSTRSLITSMATSRIRSFLRSKLRYDLMMHAVDGFFLAHAAEFLFGEGASIVRVLKSSSDRSPNAAEVVAGRDEVLDIVVEHIGDVDAYTFAEQGMMASREYM